MTYRSDIDGLRAVAVVAVILFHAKVTGFSGGYVGVDVFFVISGFLITQILRKDHEAGRYSILKFYERRARRILPALLVVLLLTLVGGYFFLLPLQYGDLGKATLATVAFISNIKFWRGAGYFQGAAEFTPLLHTWSLAVEEQFYIIFPVVLGFVLRYRRGWLGPLVVVTGLGSLLLSTVGVFLSPSATFYLIPTRAWELLIGAALALDLVPRIRSASAREWLATAGLAAIIAAVALFTPLTYFPGAAALLPCVGTALIIHAGRDQPTLVARALGAKFPVFIGLISYSLYLYHFPIFVFARFWSAGDLSALTILSCIVLTFVFATLSWRYVERPFRDPRRFTRNQIFASSIAGSAVIAALALTVVMTRGMPDRFEPRTLALAAGADDFDGRRRQCINLAVDRAPTDPNCAVGTVARRNGLGGFVLWGDSHAAAIAAAVDVAADRATVAGTLVSFNSCPPLLGIASPGLSWKDQQTCLARNEALVERLRGDPAIETIVMTGYWSAYADPARPEEAKRLETALRATIDRLGGKRIVILLDTPRSISDVPWSLALGNHFGRPPPTLVSGDDDAFARVARSIGDTVTVLSTSSLFCRGSAPCALLDRDRPILSDNNHIGATTARVRLGPYLASLNLFASRSTLPERDTTGKIPK